MRRLNSAPAARVLPALAAVVALLVLAGCSKSGTETGDPLQVVENPVAAKAAASPAQETEPAGDIRGVDGAVTSLRADSASNTLAVARAGSPAVLLYDLDDLAGGPHASVEVPGEVTDFTFTGDAVLASVPSAGTVVRIPLREPSATERIEVTGKPSSTARRDSHTLIALRDRNSVLVYDGGKVTKSVTGNLYSIHDVVVASNGEAFVLDRVRTALFHIDLAGGEIAEGLRAGVGATNAAVDSHGRVLVTDTRDNALLAFGTDPFLLRQRYPVPGGVYGITYDTERNLAWVTLTKRNEVVGFDMAGGQPVEEYRFPTVRQPNSVTVDERTGRVIVASAVGEGLQVITP